MPYLDSKGYCRKCDRVTKHRYSHSITCHNCGLKSTQLEYRQAENEFKEKQSKKYYREIVFYTRRVIIENINS